MIVTEKKEKNESKRKEDKEGRKKLQTQNQ